MKTTFSKNGTKRFIALCGIIAILAVIVCSFASCKQEADDDGKNDKDDKKDKKTAVLPLEYQNKKFEHADGYTLTLAKNEVTVTLPGGKSATYPFTKAETIANGDIVLYFDTKNDIAGLITLRNGAVISAIFPDLGSKTGNWYAEGAQPKPETAEIPEELRDTTWVHADGDSVSFTKNTVTVKPKNGAEQTFTIKSVEVINEVKTTTMYFSDEKLANYIVMRDHVITSVNLGGIGKANFKKDEKVELNGMTFEYSTEYAGYGVISYSGTAKEVIIPDNVNNTSVTYIGISAFWDKGLTSVTIPNSVTFIGGGAFFSNKLTSVIIGNNVTSIGDNAFRANQLTSVIIPNSVTTISEGAFFSNQLTSVIIGDNVTSIGNDAFCANQLTSVTIPNSVTSIGDYAFRHNKIISITIGSNVTLSEGSFSGREELYNGFETIYNDNGKAAGTYTRPSVDSTEWTKQP